MIHSKVDWDRRWFGPVVTIIVVLFPAGSLLVDRVDSVCLLSLSIIGVIAWLKSGRNVYLARAEKVVCLVYLLFFVTALLSYELGLATDVGFRFLGRYLRFLFFIPAYIALRTYRPNVTSVFVGLAIGVFAIATDATWQRLGHSSVHDIAGDTGVAITFGDIAVLMVFLAVAIQQDILSRRRRITWVVTLVLALAGLWVALLSGVRGAWLAVPVLLFVLLQHISRHWSRRMKLVTTAAATMVLVAIALLPITGVYKRLNEVRLDITRYAMMLSVNPAQGDQHVETTACGDSVVLAKAIQGQISYNPSKMQSVTSASLPHDYVFGLGSSRHFCNHINALHFFNDSYDDRAVFSISRAVRTEDPIDKALLVVKGQGIVNFSGDAATDQNVESNHFSEIAVEGQTKYADHIYLILQPKQDMYLFPLESFRGEYGFPFAQTSVGARFEMWRAAWMMFISKPLLGVGTGAYSAYAKEMVRKGEVAPIAGQFDHPHNDFMDAISTRGIVGLAALFLLFGAPALIFIKAKRAVSRAVNVAGLAGWILVLSFMIFGLTDTVLLHSFTIDWYVVYVAVFMALIYSANDAEAILQR